ncbi:MAG: hypothetical protein AB7L94_14080 [Kofleriaceae bacterium]
MKLAETARSRWVLALASVAVGATAIIAASTTCTKKPAAEATVTQVKAWRGCHQRKATPPPRREPTGSDYRDVLLTAKPAFDACTKGQPAGVTYEIRMPIGGDGHVMSVEVRGVSDDLSKVSMKVVKCLETAVAPLTFPATGDRTFVSTNIRTE